MSIPVVLCVAIDDNQDGVPDDLLGSGLITVENKLDSIVQPVFQNRAGISGGELDRRPERTRTVKPSAAPVAARMATLRSRGVSGHSLNCEDVSLGTADSPLKLPNGERILVEGDAR